MKFRRRFAIGVVGTGFIARGLLEALEHHSCLIPSYVLTRRPVDDVELPIQSVTVTNSVDELIKHSDLIVECTGDVIHGTEVVAAVHRANLPVVTMNSELQLTSGSQLCQTGVFIEAEGDQPGSLAALDLELKDMGFEPLVYGNIKRFLNTTPTREDMLYWAKKQKLSLPQVTAFTDGSKVQIEQALVANGLGVDVVQPGMLGMEYENFEEGAHALGAVADEHGRPISDYILSSTGPAGVFIVAHHRQPQKHYLNYLKLGDGPYYVLYRPYHLCHLEIPKTILHILRGHSEYHFNNTSAPRYQVTTIAKRDLKAGTRIQRGLGGFDVRGEMVPIDGHEQEVPIALMHNAQLTRSIRAGERLSFEDVVLPKSLALSYWKQTVSALNDKVAIFHGEPIDTVGVEDPKTSWWKDLLNLDLTALPGKLGRIR